MGGFVRGDVVVLNFPFSDLSGAKRRPALVIADLDGDDVILCQITGQSRVDRYAIELCAEDYKSGKLAATSVVRPNKIFTADKKMILYVACKINCDKTDEITKAIINIIHLIYQRS